MRQMQDSSVGFNRAAPDILKYVTVILFSLMIHFVRFFQRAPSSRTSWFVL